MFKWVLRILLILLIVVTGGIGLVIALQPTIELSPHREFIARQLGASIGREVTLEGEIQLTLGRHTRVHVGRLRIGNPDWAESPHLLAAKDLDVGVDLAALTSGVVHLEEIRLVDVSIAAETLSDGRNSWELGQPDAEPVGRKPVPAAVRWVVEDAIVNGLELTYRDPQRTKPVVLAIDHLQQRADGESMLLGATGSINQTALRVSGRAGTFDAVLAGRNIKLDLEVSLGNARLQIAGVLGRPATLEGITLRSSLKSPDLAALVADLGFARPIQGDADLAVEIDDGNPGLVFVVIGNLGAHKLDLRGAIEQPLELDGLRAEVDVAGPDLAALGQLFGFASLPAEAYRLTGSLLHASPMLEFQQFELRSGSSLLSVDGTLPEFPSVSNAGLQANLAVEDVGLIARLFDGAPPISGPLSLKASVESPTGGKTVVDVDAQWRDNQISIRGPLGRNPDYLGSHLRFDVSGPDLVVLLGLAGVKSDFHEPFRFAGDLDVAADGLVGVTLDGSRVGTIETKAEGSLGRLPELENIELAVELRGESLNASLARLVDTPLPSQGFVIAAKASGPVAAPILRTLDARVGGTRLQTRGPLGLLPPHVGTDTMFELSVPRLADWVPGQGASAWSAQGYRASGRLRKAGGTFRLQGVSLEADTLTWQLDGSISERWDLVTATLNAKTGGKDARLFLPDIPGYRPAHRPFDIAVQLGGGVDHVAINDLRIDWAGAEVRGKGRIALDGSAVGSAMNVDLSVPRLSDLGSVDAIIMPALSLRLTAQLQQSKDGYRVPQIAIDVAGGSVQGKLALSDEERRRLTVDLTAKGIDFQPFLQQPKARLAAETSASTPSSKHLIPDQALPFIMLKEFDGSLRLRGTELNYPDHSFPGKTLVSKIDLSATLDRGVLTVENLRIDGDHGDVQVRGAIDASGRAAAVEMALETEAFRIGALASAQGLAASPSNEISFQFQGRGNTLRELAATANGTGRLVAGSGRTTNTGLDQKLGSFSYELLRTVNPFIAREDHTQIDCGAAAFVIRDGVLQLSPGLAVRTDRVDITASGTIDLRTEAVDVQFRNAARRGLGISLAGVVRPYVGIRGSLASPRLALDAPGALVAGTAAVATGGISVLVTSLFDRASTATNPCQRLIAAADEERNLRSMNPLDSLSGALRRGAREPTPAGAR